MKRQIILSLLLITFGWGEKNKLSPYISPGIQLGYNTDKGLFYGFQISVGFSYFGPNWYIYLPSVCYGDKRYFKSKNKEKYFDIQIMSLPDTRGNPSGLPIPLGVGVGRNYSNEGSSIRVKGYTWLFSCITFDYEIKNKSKNISLIPILPIGDS